MGYMSHPGSQTKTDLLRMIHHILKLMARIGAMKCLKKGCSLSLSV